MRTASVFGSAALFVAMHANICPPIFSAGAPYIVLSSAPGIRRPIARTVRNVMRSFILRDGGSCDDDESADARGHCGGWRRGRRGQRAGVADGAEEGIPRRAGG